MWGSSACITPRWLEPHHVATSYKSRWFGGEHIFIHVSAIFQAFVETFYRQSESLCVYPSNSRHAHEKVQVSKTSFTATNLGSALLLEHGLVLFPQFLVDLGSLGGLVAVYACRQGSILLPLQVLERLLLTLLLALLLALELVGN